MNIVKGSVEKLPFDDEIFDKILTVESFYFWPKPEENLKEVHRVLARGGTFLLAAEIYGGAPLSQSAIENIDKYSLYNPTPDEFIRLFQSAGFSSIKVHTADCDNRICVEGHK